MKAVDMNHLVSLQEQGALLVVDDPYPVNPRPRWGHGQPPHKLLADLFCNCRQNYAPFLDAIVSLRSSFAAIPCDAPEDSISPRWNNGWLPALDGMSIYAALSANNPRYFIEVGSGNSTKFAAQAIRDHGLGTKIISIDPCPRSEVDTLCHRTIREPLESLDTTFFNIVKRSDIVFVDCSHRCLQNSDVTVFFLEVLPRLPPGCLIGIHDICLPLDYPPGWERRYYNEQYILAAALLFGSSSFDILFPSYYISVTPALREPLATFDSLPCLNGVRPCGSIFWFRKR